MLPASNPTKRMHPKARQLYRTGVDDDTAPVKGVLLFPKRSSHILCQRTITTGHPCEKVTARDARHAGGLMFWKNEKPEAFFHRMPHARRCSISECQPVLSKDGKDKREHGDRDLVEKSKPRSRKLLISSRFIYPNNVSLFYSSRGQGKTRDKLLIT